MATGAKLGVTTTLQKGDAASPEVFTTVAEITAINNVGADAAQIDVTNMDSASSTREFIAGLKEGTEFGFDGNYTSSATHTGLHTDLVAGTLRNWKITWPNTKVWTFAGIITKFNVSAEAASAVKYSAAIKISGAITIS